MKRTSAYQSIAEMLEEGSGDEGIILTDLDEIDAEELRDYLERRLGEGD